MFYVYYYYDIFLAAGADEPESVKPAAQYVGYILTSVKVIN